MLCRNYHNLHRPNRKDIHNENGSGSGIDAFRRTPRTQAASTKLLQPPKTPMPPRPGPSQPQGRYAARPCPSLPAKDVAHHVPVPRTMILTMVVRVCRVHARANTPLHRLQSLCMSWASAMSFFQGILRAGLRLGEALFSFLRKARERRVG